MIHRVEVALKPGIADARGSSVKDSIRSFLEMDVDEVRVRDVLKIDSDLDDTEIEKVRQEFTDPVIQESALGILPAADYDWVVVVGFNPGVTDNVGRSARIAVEDITGRPFPSGKAIYTECEYFLKGGGLSCDDVWRVGRDLLANVLIERVGVLSAEEREGSDPDLYVPVIEGLSEIRVDEVNLDVGDEELLRISSEGILSLNLNEMKTIQGHFRRPEVVKRREAASMPANPTDAELECLAQTWSEHCKHKIFNAEIDYSEPDGVRETIRSLFDTYIRGSTEEIAKKVDWLVSVFHDNAGVVRFDDTTNLVFKVETHNSPSALDPYGGAMTGIVGVNRDPFGTGLGSELLVNVWGYCLGNPFYRDPLPEGLLHPRRIRDGVHKGVIDGGNQSGIPYGTGWEYFDDRYIGKPLVFCGTVGIMPRTLLDRPSHVKRVAPGDRIVMVGGRIGKDGIHGATFSSEELHGASPVQAVQIGNPIVQKMMTDFLLEARDRGLYSGITDNGAGGLSSSVGEMACQPGGAELDLSRSPLKYQGLQPWEILVSEAQERMTLAVPEHDLKAFMELAARREVEATDLGRFTDTGLFQVTWGDRPVALLDMDFLHDGVPTLKLTARWDPPRHEEPGRDGGDLSERLTAVLADLNVCSIEKKSRQYDHEVKGLSVVKPFVGARNDVDSDATVFLARHGSSREGIVLARGINPSLSDVDTYRMAASVIDEAVRRIVAVGGRTDRIAGLDNFCWPDPELSDKTPDGPYKLAQLVRANRAISDVTRVYCVPCISGKDSMKNDSTRGGVKISVPPTLLFSTVGKIDDVSKAVTLDAKAPGDGVYVLGRTGPELGGSVYYRIKSREEGRPLAIGSEAPPLDPEEAIEMYRLVETAISAGLLNSCHAPTLGGLGVALARVALGGDLGIEADLASLPASGSLRADEILFAESNARFVVTVSPGREAELRALFEPHPHGRIGVVTTEKRLRIRGPDGLEVDADVDTLREAWQSTLASI
ncbi:MAG: phosphoribosylformylglycinamidine synthase subunit PurS [Planctomycetota bacterium]|jgi:phosphoribosylformylglycinamidine synthase